MSHQKQQSTIQLLVKLQVQNNTVMKVCIGSIVIDSNEGIETRI